MGRERDLEAVDARRLDSERPLKRSMPHAEVARQSGVSRHAVSK